MDMLNEKDDNDWVKRCITWEVEGIREYARKRPGGIVLRMTWKVIGLFQKGCAVQE